MARATNLIDTTWRPKLAYVVGLITADGNLSPDGRHINLTSKDKSLCELTRDCLGLKNIIGKKARGGSVQKRYFVLQFGSVQFYAFLVRVGLKPAKSKTLAALKIPASCLSDFLRGCIDGDGSIGSYTHPESRHPQLRVRLASASPKFLEWVHEKIRRLWHIKGGWVYQPAKRGWATLEFGKSDSIQILKRLYRDGSDCCLKRKYDAAKIYLGE